MTARLIPLLVPDSEGTRESAPVRRGLGWLRTNQRVSGRWFTHSLNWDSGHSISNAGTAYAVMALRAWDGTDP